MAKRKRLSSRQRPWVAMGERQMEGLRWKYPWETWGDCSARVAATSRQIAVTAGGRYIRVRQQEQSLLRKLLPPQQVGPPVTFPPRPGIQPRGPQLGSGPSKEELDEG